MTLGDGAPAEDLVTPVPITEPNDGWASSRRTPAHMGLTVPPGWNAPWGSLAPPYLHGGRVCRGRPPAPGELTMLLGIVVPETPIVPLEYVVPEEVTWALAPIAELNDG